MCSMSINTNLNALSAHRHMTIAEHNMNQQLTRIASSLRINRAADDVAGLAISETMRSGLRGTQRALHNVQDGLSLLQTAEGGIESVQGNLQRMRELSIQAANDPTGPVGRQAIQMEIDQLVEEIDRTVGTVEFNRQPLLTGDFSEDDEALAIHAGPGRDDLIGINISAMDSEELGIDALDVTSGAGAQDAVEVLTNALSQVSTERASVGSLENRLEGAVDFLRIQDENLTAAESRIRDADIAAESTDLARNRVLLQAALSTLGQTQNIEAGMVSSLL